MAHLLVLCGDIETRRSLIGMLEQENFTAVAAASAEAGLRQARALNWQLILTDLAFAGINGVELCMQLRASAKQIPMIVLTHGDEIDRIMLLEAGADDCMLKPFSMRELLARIRAVLRRAVAPPERTIRFAEVEIDPERRVIKRQGKDIAVTPCEYKLLLFFLQNADRPLTRDVLLNFVWGYEHYPNTRTVDTHVMKLRNKLEPDPSIPRHFVTIHGVGYRFLM
ncbi:MAG: response regulator transcription factor [Bryobacteraceae bacterium]